MHRKRIRCGFDCAHLPTSPCYRFKMSFTLTRHMVYITQNEWKRQWLKINETVCTQKNDYCYFPPIRKSLKKGVFKGNPNQEHPVGTRGSGHQGLREETLFSEASGTRPPTDPNFHRGGRSTTVTENTLKCNIKYKKVGFWIDQLLIFLKNFNLVE